MTTHTPLRCAYSSMASDGYNNTIVLMNPGAYPGFSSYLNETWVFNGTNGSGDWTNTGATLIDANGPLPGRLNQIVSYDGYQVMLYGGAGAASGQIFQDTWTYTFTGSVGAWTKQSPTTSPFGRFGAKSAYLSGSGGNAAMVMFGGYGGAGNGVYLNETWIWNGSALTWTLLNFTNGTNPAARIGHVFAANTTDGYLFGGQGSNSQFNDTWAFTYSGGVGTWTKLTPAISPSVRSGACMSYDPTNHLFVMFGGTNEYNYLVETWTYTPATNTWAQIAVANGVGPAGRVGAQMAWDPVSGKTIMFGGIAAGDSYPTNTTWSFDGSALTWTKL